MGYCMRQAKSKFSIPRSNFAKCLEVMRGLGTGSWTDNPKNAKTIGEAFECWRWEVSYTDDSGIEAIDFVGEKYGDEEKLFQTVAPFVDEGSFIEMIGEDGGRWRWMFTGKTCKEVKAKVSWE